MPLTHQFIYAPNSSTGKPLDGVVVRMFTNPGNVLAVTYADRALTPKTVLVTGAPIEPGPGQVDFYIEQGNYDIEFNYGGDNVERITDFPMTGDASNTFTLASQAEAEAGVENTKVTTPLRVKQAIEAQLKVPLVAPSGSSLVNTIQAGTGAVSETLQTAGRRTIFAQQFGTAQQAYDANTTNGNTINLDVGTIATGLTCNTRKMMVRGKSKDASIVSPSTATGVAIRGTYATAGWEAPTFSDFTILGTGTRQGTGFKSGPDAYSANAEYIGRTIFERVKFDNLEYAIQRPFGNIGLWVNESQFETCDYHIFTSDNNSGSGDAMHAGNTVVSNSHFQYAQKACVYVEGSTTGTGQITYQNNIFETNAGYVFYIDGLNSIDGHPGLNVFNCWNETNYTAGTVTIGGDTAAPVFAKLKNSPGNYFHDTPIGPLRLTVSHVITNQCDLSKLTAIETDTLSSTIHDNARMFTGTAKGLVRSIAAVANQTGSNPFFPMPLPKYMRANLPNVVTLWDAQSVVTFTGTNTRDSVPVTNNPALPAPFNRSQTFTINTGESENPNPVFTVPADKWLVWQYIARIVSGPSITVNITGTSGFGGAMTIEGSEWRCYTGISQRVGAAIANEYFNHSAGASTTVIGIGGIALLSFDSAQAALDYANSGAFPYTLGATVASAATITLPNGQDVITISGTTGITSITATAADTGRTATLVFADALTVTDGSNLKMNGNFVTTADDTLTLSCDGTNWYETGRSAN